VYVEKSEKSTKRFYCFRKADFRRLSCYISGIDWSNLYSSQNLEDAINIFLIALSSLFNSCVLLYYPSISNKQVESAKGSKGKWRYRLKRFWALEWAWHIRVKLGLRNLNLKSQFNIFDSFRDVHVRFKIF